MSIKSYDGNEKYVFVSYAHKDSSRVMPIINALREYGCRIWCDEKLIVGENYNAAIARHLRDCDAVLFFLSENWMRSKYCRSEATVGIEQFDKKVALLYLESCTIHDEVMMLLAGKHTVRTSDPQYFDKLIQSPALRDCIGEQEARESSVSSDDRMQQLFALSNTPEGRAMLEMVLGKAAAPSESDPNPSEGLLFELGRDGSYCVKGIGNCTGTEIVIPCAYRGKPVTYICEDAFYDCTSLTSISIPDSVDSIGASAFFDCTSLTDIIIPDGVTDLGEYVFSGCTSLASISIPNSVESIAVDTFSGCTSLTTILYRGTKNEWETKVWCAWGWNSEFPATTVHCTDGTSTI